MLLDMAYVKWYAFSGGEKMTTLTATKAREMLYKLLDRVAHLHEPIQITGKIR